VTTKEYLEMMVAARAKVYRREGYAYTCIANFVLKHGTEHEKAPVQPFPTQEKKRCFRNAYMMACEHGLRYMEGYALGQFLPVHHAWNLDEHGRVIDTTDCWQDGSEYIGVQFSIEQVAASSEGSVLDDWKNGFPILKEEWKP
jgi:hypothetical protein